LLIDAAAATTAIVGVIAAGAAEPVEPTFPIGSAADLPTTTTIEFFCSDHYH
jgi:hypothetical protein